MSMLSQVSKSRPWVPGAYEVSGVVVWPSAMSALFDSAKQLWSWITHDSAANGTGLLVVITAFYAYLTAHMAKTMSRQTRAMVQPIASLEIHWDGDEYTPKGHFEIKNLGSQPILLLDVKLTCVFRPMFGLRHNERWEFVEHQTLWDENIVPPGKPLQPMFDFTRRLKDTNDQWSANELGYELRVVASDLSRSVVLTYGLLPILSVAYCRAGIPSEVRMRYLRDWLRHHRRRIVSWMPKNRRGPKELT